MQKLQQLILTAAAATNTTTILNSFKWLLKTYLFQISFKSYSDICF